MNAPARPDPARRRALLAAVAAPVALAALPAALSAAPVITTDAICLRPSQKPNGDAVSPPLTIVGSGFTPGQVVPIQRGARTFYTVAEDTGGFTALLSVLDRLNLTPPKSSPLDLVATDPSLGPSNALRVRTAPLEFDATPKRTRPSNTVTFRFSGFEPDRADLRPLPLQRARAGERADGEGQQPVRPPHGQARSDPGPRPRDRALADPVRPQPGVLAAGDAAHPRDRHRVPDLPDARRPAARARPSRPSRT